jgi:peptidoglycan/LPS O-acetylase OafA/YrhL
VLARARALADAAPIGGATGGARHVAAIDGLRAVAAFVVVSVHVATFVRAPEPSQLANVASAPGQAVVTVFLSISAYVLYRPFVAARAAGAPEPSLANFLIRRFVRILPAYWLLLTALALLGHAPGVLSDNWWRYYLLLQIYASDPLIGAGGIAPAWTVAVEASFYLLLAVLVVMLRRRWRAGRSATTRWRGELVVPLAFFAIGTIPWIVTLYDPSLGYLRVTLAGTLGWFAAGMGCAVLSVRAEHGLGLPPVVRALRDHPALCWAAGVGVIAWIATVPRFPTPGNLAITLSPVDATLVVLAGVVAGMLLSAPVLLGADGSGRIMRVLSSRPLAFAGLIAFGTYLSHHALVLILVAPWHGIDAALPKTLLGIAIVYPLALAIGAASWYLVERPLMRGVGRALRNRRARREKPAPGTPIRSPA